VVAPELREDGRARAVSCLSNCFQCVKTRVARICLTMANVGLLMVEPVVPGRIKGRVLTSGEASSKAVAVPCAMEARVLEGGLQVT
jgi:hypothetical protein